MAGRYYPHDTKFKELSQAEFVADDGFGSEDEESFWDSRPCLVKVIGSCCCCLVLLVIAGIVATNMFMDQWSTESVVNMGTETFGVTTTVDEVSVSILSARYAISRLLISSPPGFIGDFIALETGVWDMKLSTLFSRPVEIQEMRFDNLMVNIDQHADGDSNAKQIMDHIALVSQSEESKRFAETMEKLNTTVTVDQISFHNIQARFCVHPSCDVFPTKFFVINQVQISNVGYKTGGVTIPELMEIIVRAVVFSAIRAAPSQLENPLANSLSNSVVKALDYAQMHYDVGQGLQRAGAQAGFQLGMLSNSTKQLGTGLAAALQQSAPSLATAVEKTMGIQNPNDAAKLKIKQNVDVTTQALSNGLAEGVSKVSAQLSQKEKELATNMSSAMSSIAKILKPAAQQPPQSALP